MKIGIDISTLQDKYYSGVSEYTHNLLNEILSLDGTNEYILYYNSFSDVDINFKIESRNVKFFRTYYPNKLFNYGMQKILHTPKIDKLIGGVDVFFSPHLNFYSLSSDCYKIITIHDVSFLRYKDFFSIRKNLWHSAINIKKLLRQYDKVIAVSKNTKNDLIDLCDVPSEKIEVIYSGICDDMRKIDFGIESESQYRESIIKKYDLPEKFILYLGNIEPRKNIETIIKAFDLLCQEKTFLKFQLVITGARCWKSKNTIQAWQNSENKEKIKFLGYIDKDEKKYLYNLANIFVYPSFYEGFGFPPLEAIFCACPTVISSNSSLAEVVGKLAVSVDSFNVNSLKRAIKETLLNEKNIISKSIFMPNFKQNFCWKNTAERIIKIINNKNITN